MSSTFIETPNGNRAILGFKDGEWFEETQDRKAHAKYVTVNPAQVQYALRRGGYEVKRVDKLMGSRPGWTQALEIRGKQGPGLPENYRPMFKMLFDHQGRHALKILPGALCIDCTNAFVGQPCWRARHTDGDKIREMLKDPVALFEQLSEWTEDTYAKLDLTRYMEVKPIWRAFWERARPRVGKLVDNELRTRYTGGSMWDMLQAATEIKRPGAQSVSDLVLGAGWNETFMKGIPSVLVSELARADVARLN